MGQNIQKVGGQAVLEGVMMRAGDRVAVAVRNLEGEICMQEEEISSWGARFPFLRWPIVRGAAGMIESLKIGAKALHFSAQTLGEEDEEETSSWLSTLMMAVGFGLALLAHFRLHVGDRKTHQRGGDFGLFAGIGGEAAGGENGFLQRRRILPHAP